MNTNTTNQTAKDIAQVVEITTQRLYELGKIANACPHEVETLGTLKVAAQGALEKLREAA
jgi:CO dehydrogenase/acetyl-CoA synthase alpha subunit